MVELYEFQVKDKVHAPHPAADKSNAKSDGTCWGRIFRLAYPFGWQHFYCDRECCNIPLGRDPDTGEEIGGRHHVKCVTDFTFTDFWHCIDCGRIGTIAERPKLVNQAEAMGALP